jgi:hypothetical protein
MRGCRLKSASVQSRRRTAGAIIRRLQTVHIAPAVTYNKLSLQYTSFCNRSNKYVVSGSATCDQRVECAQELFMLPVTWFWTWPRTGGQTLFVAKEYWYKNKYIYSGRGESARFAYFTSLWVEGKQRHKYVNKICYRHRNWDSELQSTATGK